MTDQVDLNLNHLLLLTAQVPMLDQIEKQLHFKHSGLVARLIKLQQDAGVEIARSFGDVGEGLKEGSPAKTLHTQYTPVTKERLTDVFQEAHDLLPKGNARIQLEALMTALG